jgi:NAD-dependent SIR2 family protein deacetylase
MGDAFASPSDPVVAGLAAVRGDLAQFARVVDVQGAQLAWLLGAGTSAMSGIPTAGALALRFKHELYCAAHGLDVQAVDHADRPTRRLIEDYFDGKHGLPPNGDAQEYSVAFEQCYPSADVRADFIAGLCRGRRPGFGHDVLAALMATGRLRVVFTTNFDELIETGATALFDAVALDPRPSVVVADLGDPRRAVRALLKESWPLIAKLHGDFRSVRLKNTIGELAEQDAAMRGVLRTACHRFGLVVSGYSGRDESVMAVLKECAQDKDAFPAGVYWCYRPTDPPGAAVVELLTSVQKTGRTASAIPVDNFVELAGAVERAVRLPEAVRTCLVSRRPPAIVKATPLPSGPVDQFPILRLNALPIAALPTEVRLLRSSSAVDLREAQRAIRAARARGLIARRSGGSLVALGHDGELTGALSPLGITVTDAVEQLDWSAAIVDPADLGLLLDAVTLGLGRTYGLRHVLARRGHQVRVNDATAPGLERLAQACKKPLMGTIPKTSVPFAEAVGLTVDRRDMSWWLLVVPELWTAPIRRLDGSPDAAQPRDEQGVVADFVRDRYAARYNRDVNAILDAWVRVLCGGRGPREVRTWNIRPEEGLDATFELIGSTAFSRPFSTSSATATGRT